jgi:hypothetical protein
MVRVLTLTHHMGEGALAHSTVKDPLGGSTDKERRGTESLTIHMVRVLTLTHHMGEGALAHSTVKDPLGGSTDKERRGVWGNLLSRVRCLDRVLNLSKSSTD